MQEQIGKQNLHKFGSSDESMTKLSSAALSSVTSTGSVETFPLVRPSSTNKFEGVYIYLDEVGMLKHVSSQITFPRHGRSICTHNQTRTVTEQFASVQTCCSVRLQPCS